MSFRLAVLSDLHVDRDADGESWNLAKEAFAVVAREKPDHMVIAGDLFDSASALERDCDRVKQRLRLEEFADDAGVDAIVCGHIHVGGARSWTVGRSTKVFRAGETGGLHGTKPSFLVLEIPRRGAVRCRRVRF